MSDTPIDDPSPSGAPAAQARPPGRRRIAIALIAGIVTATLVAGGLVLGGAFDADDQPSAPTANERPAPASGSAPAPEPPATVTRITDADVKALTDARTKALADGDATAFVSGIDPANTELIARQRRLFANLRLFPFARAEFRPPMTPEPLQGTDAGAYAHDIVVAFVHRLDGVDRGETAELYTWSMSRAAIDAPLRITEIGAGPTSNPLAGIRYPAAWDGEELAVLEREHVLMAVAAEDRDRAGAWADQAETAARRNAEAWQGPAITPRRFAIFVATSGETARLVLGASGVAGSCELVSPARPGGRGMTPVGARVAFDGTRAAFTSTAPDAAIGLIRSELAQAMVAQFARSSQLVDGYSRWVSEGFARYLGADHGYEPSARAELRTGRFTGRLPRDGDLTARGSGDQAAGASHHFAILAMRYLTEKYGAAKADAFVVAMYADPASVDEAIKAATGLDRARFEADWADYVRAELAG